MAFLTQQGIPLTVVGDGTNILVRDGGIEGAVISLAGIDTAIDDKKADGTIFLTVPAGVKTQHLCRFAAVRGYQGLNFATGIPGTVGGALAMNAGTDKGAFGEVVESLTLIDVSGKLRTVEAGSLDFKYRHLAIEGMTRHDADFPIIVSARLRLEAGDREVLVSEREALLARRKASQPVNLPSAGCFLKTRPRDRRRGNLLTASASKGRP